MAGHPLFWLDVFTGTPLAGNPLAVVLEADGITDESMLAFAREVGLSETTFVQTADESSGAASREGANGEGANGEGADYRNRIWTISEEIPFAGHPSLGTAVAVAISRGVEKANFVQQTQVGLQPVDVEAVGGSDARIWNATMLQEPARFQETFPAARVAPALGLEVDQIGPHLTSQMVSTGLPTLLVPIASREALSACRPDFNKLRSLDENHALNLYAFHFDVAPRHVYARCFAADMGDIEDPATGSAAGPLVAYLQDCLDVDRITIDQGVEMGRPSRIEARMESGRPRISGEVSLVSRGEVHLP